MMFYKSVNINRFLILQSYTSFGMQQSFATSGTVAWNDVPASVGR